MPLHNWGGFPHSGIRQMFWHGRNLSCYLPDWCIYGEYSLYGCNCPGIREAGLHYHQSNKSLLHWSPGHCLHKKFQARYNDYILWLRKSEVHGKHLLWLHCHSRYSRQIPCKQYLSDHLHERHQGKDSLRWNDVCHTHLSFYRNQSNPCRGLYRWHLPMR